MINTTVKQSDDRRVGITRVSGHIEVILKLTHPGHIFPPLGLEVIVGVYLM